MMSTNYRNIFPDCLFLKINGEQISDLENDSADKIKLNLTIRFGKEKFQIGGATVTFGLRSGKLHLKFGNSKILMETIGLTPRFQTYIEIERQTDISQTGGKTMAYTVKPGLTTINQQVSTETTRIKDEIYQVQTQGTEEEMSWIFQLKTEKAILEGILQAEQLGIIELESKPCMIEATFEVQDKDIQITQTSGLWDQSMSQEVIGNLERKFYSEFIKPKLKSYISKAELLYE